METCLSINDIPCPHICSLLRFYLRFACLFGCIQMLQHTHTHTKSQTNKSVVCLELTSHNSSNATCDEPKRKSKWVLSLSSHFLHNYYDSMCMMLYHPLNFRGILKIDFKIWMRHSVSQNTKWQIHTQRKNT